MNTMSFHRKFLAWYVRVFVLAHGQRWIPTPYRTGNTVKRCLYRNAETTKKRDGIGIIRFNTDTETPIPYYGFPVFVVLPVRKPPHGVS